MLPDWVSNPGPLTYESGALPIALRGPAQNKSYYDLFNMGSLQRVWRCRQTNLVLDKGGVKISTRNRPLSP